MGNSTSSQSLLRTWKFDSLLFENREDVTLIWLDKTIDTTRTTLREITDYVLLYTDLEPCLACIRAIANERILLIISDSYAELSLDEIHDLPQVHSIFVFCMRLGKQRRRQSDWHRFTKIIDVFDNEDQLIQSIRTELVTVQKHLLTFSFYDKHKSLKDLTKETATFLWFQLFRDVLPRIPKVEQAHSEMVERCREYYQGNAEELGNIEKFAQTYNESKAIQWYTKPSFITRLCDKALRTKDIELLYICRSYMDDLSRCLALGHQSLTSRELNQPILILYRGLQLTGENINRFQANIGSLISANGFLLATRNYHVALQSALRISTQSLDISPVLFIIQTNVHHDHVIFADTASLNKEAHGEEEVLFDLGCAFRINEVYFDKSGNVWIISISSTDDGRHLADSYIDENQSEMEKGNVLLLFGSLLTEMRQYQQAEIYWEKLIASNLVDDKVSLFTNTGRVKYYQGLQHEALQDFRSAYNILRGEKPINYRNLARIMHFLGLVYLEQRNFDQALDYQFDVFKIHKQHDDLPELLLANTNNSIGIVFTHKHDYDQALKYLFRAMHLYEKCFSRKEHAIVAANYNSIGLVFYYTKQYSEALEYCLEALNIREEVLPKTHSNIADSCNNIALIYHHLCDYDQALRLFQRALQIYENETHHRMRIPICLNNIGLLYLDQHNYDRAIEYYLQALEIYNSGNHEKKYQEEIGFTLDNLALAFEMKGDFDNALKYYQLALEAQEEDSEKAVRILIRIGNIHHKKADNDQALACYQSALSKSERRSSDLVASVLMSIGIVYHRQQRYELALDTYKHVASLQKQLASNHELDLAWTYNNIGCLYDDMDDIRRALKYQQKAYDIRRKFLQSTHPDLAISLNNLGRIHQILAHRSGGNPIESEQALQNYKAALHIRRKSLAVDHPDLAISYYNLALIHVDQQEYEQAYIEIQKALNIQKKKLPPDHPDLEQTLKLEKRIKILLNYRHSLARYM